MAEVPVLTTDRLILRGWEDGDRAPFAAMNADPTVMRFYPSTLSADESDAYWERLRDGWSRGFGMWAVTGRSDGVLLGSIGFSVLDFISPFTPCVEIGWRLASSQWGQGLAPEGARAALRWAATTGALGTAEVVSVTAVVNEPSQRVMEKIGFHHNPDDDFEHPRVSGTWLGPHVLYRGNLADYAGG
jgi:ribosomal-protein-alanine N-acetyltransferase